MILAVAATQMELAPFLDSFDSGLSPVATLVSGVGPVQSAVRLGRFLQSDSSIELVVNFGVAGAYILPDGQKQPKLLDLCLASSEVFGDLGICLGEKLEYLDEQLTGRMVIDCDCESFRKMKKILKKHNISYYDGPFITVNSVSGTAARGRFLQQRWGGLCENMEGAALAQVCQEYGLPIIELRTISNLVEDRDQNNWCLVEAAARAGRTAARIVEELVHA
jgi:futalosine hydrolase